MTDPAAPDPRIPRAASILLLRPGHGPSTGTGTGTGLSLGERPQTAPEVFTITRSARLVFSAGVSAFPGGRVDPVDELPADLWAGTDLATWAGRLGLEPTTAGMVLAGAVRETFEETGVLLARHADGTPVGPEALAALPADARLQVEHGGLDFGELLTEHGLRPDVTGMQPLSRWITPPGPPRRYDTFFLAAALPEAQSPGALSFEGIASRWTTAADALADFRSGRHRLMAPTWAQFHSLLTATTLAEALAPRQPLLPVMPGLEDPSAGPIIDFAEVEAFERDLHITWPNDKH